MPLIDRKHGCAILLRSATAWLLWEVHMSREQLCGGLQCVSRLREKPAVLTRPRVVPLVALLSLLLSPMHAQRLNESGVNNWRNSAYLLGDWGGQRTRLENAGVGFNLIYVNDLLADTRGDLANWSRVRGTLDIDFGKAEIARGLKFHITAMWQAGG